MTPLEESIEAFKNDETELLEAGLDREVVRMEKATGIGGLFARYRFTLDLGRKNKYTYIIRKGSRTPERVKKSDFTWMYL